MYLLQKIVKIRQKTIKTKKNTTKSTDCRTLKMYYSVFLHQKKHFLFNYRNREALSVKKIEKRKHSKNAL